LLERAHFDTAILVQSSLFFVLGAP
jgi:hypothetical protein